LSRDPLADRYEQLKTRRITGEVSFLDYVKGVTEIAKEYVQVLDENNLMLHPQEVPHIA